MSDKSQHPWIEASGRVAEIMDRWGIPKVPFELARMILPGKKLEQVDEYSYRRSLSGGPAYTKTVYGFPNVPHQASWEPSQGKGYARRPS